MATSLLNTRVREQLSDTFETQRLRIQGYDQRVLEEVRERDAYADAEIATATPLPDQEAIERLRFLLREHSKGTPPTETDTGWPSRLRAVRALRNYEASLRASAIPELMDLLTKEQGYLPLEIRDLLIDLRCDVLPATQQLIDMVEQGDPSRAELALSVLAHLSMDCPEQFHSDKEITGVIIVLLQDPTSIGIRESLIRSLTIFDKKGEFSDTTLQDIIKDPKSSEELRNGARGARVQMGLPTD
ncbi:MAG: hypothetical protein FJ308_18470 [Planctomycetes bacterium]|nr:hypothetical protein [Planctomycetota bacterium]